jgi:hypothetical protein
MGTVSDQVRWGHGVLGQALLVADLAASFHQPAHSAVSPLIPALGDLRLRSTFPSGG